MTIPEVEEADVSAGRLPKLTKAQQRCLASVGAGTVHLHFDVYGGYWWTEKTGHRGRRSTAQLAPSPISRLLDMKLIETGAVTRPFSGRHLTPYRLTEAGAAALATLRTQDSSNDQ